MGSAGRRESAPSDLPSEFASSITLKENLLWVRSIATVAELVEAHREFRLLYNERWLIGRHGFRSPSQVRRDRQAATRSVA